MSLYLTLESSDKCEIAKKAEKKCTDGRKHCSKNPHTVWNFTWESCDRGSQEKIQDSREQKMVGYKG